MLDHLVRPGDEVLHVRPVFMSAIVLAPSQLAIRQPCIDRGHFGELVLVFVTDVLDPEQTKYGTRGNGSHVTALLIKPVGISLFGDSITDESGARSTKRDQLMRVDRDIAGVLAAKRCIGGPVLQEVSSHPVILAGSRQIFDGFSEIAPMQLGAAFAG